MILDITQSKLFKVSPDVRFSKEYAVPLGTWIEVWRRYKLLGYLPKDIKDYMFIKYARNLSYNTIDRWIVCNEIYDIASPLIKKGVVHVNSDIFRDWEQNVMNELVKTLKSGSTSSSRSII